MNLEQQIEIVLLDLLNQIVQVDNSKLTLELPIRKKNNFPIISDSLKEEEYDFEEEYNTSKYNNNEMSICDFFNFKSTAKFTCCIQTLNFIQQLTSKNKFTTKRDLYYMNKPLFQNQIILNQIIDDFAFKFNCNRYHLHIVASPKGEVAGNFKYYERSLTDSSISFTKTFQQEEGILIDLNYFRNVGKVIPSVPEIQITSFDIPIQINSILIIEKEAVFHQLLNNYDNFIMITGKGYPCIATRNFIVMLVKYIAKYQRRSLNIYIFTDGDPYGAEIANIYMNGSKSLQHEREVLTLQSTCINDWMYWVNESYKKMKWIGLHVQDYLQKQHVSPNALLPLDNLDKRKIEQLLNDDNCHLQIKEQLILMNECGVKAEIEALCTKYLNYSDFLEFKINN
ncbi:hypothetical protein ABK040_006805 [Willaertia magna]